MKTLKRQNDRIKGFASLANIGYDLYEVNLEGEVYKRSSSRRSMRYKAERVGSDRWKIYACDVSGRLIEQVMRTDVLVGCAWCNVDEKLWENSTYADIIRRCKEFFSISNLDKDITDYKTKNGFSYYVTKYGEVWNTETMTKVNGCIRGKGYRHVNLGSANNVKVHRLVAYHFVHSIPKDLLDQGLSKKNLVVNHLDGNKLNNRWDNLEWTTIRGNIEHASINGLLHTTIDKHVLERIWQLLQEGYSDTYISKVTGVHVHTVNDIRHGTLPRYRTDKYTWPKSSVDVHAKERCELAMKCVEMFNQGMSHRAIANKLGSISKTTVTTLIGKYRDLITRTQAKRTKLDKATIFSIYDKFVYTDMNNCEIARQYNVSHQYIADLRRGDRHSNLAHEYITSKGLDGYWRGYNPSK